eukprot:gene7356-10026_t
MTEISQTQKKPTIIHLWCAPRSLSTCTMYSFSRRPDCVKLYDEPLYAHWLRYFPDVYRPYREELLASNPTPGSDVLESICNIHPALNLDGKQNIVFVKHMAKHWVGNLDKTVLYGRNHKHIFLIRNPLEMIQAWDIKIDVHKENCSLDSLGLLLMLSLFSDLRSNMSEEPIVVDSNMLKENPSDILPLLCAKLSIPFYEEQLSWPAGPKPDIDGIWASYWYDSVHQSTGFSSFVGSKQDKYLSKMSDKLTMDEIALYRESLPFYDFLKQKALGVDRLCPGSSFNVFDLKRYTLSKKDDKSEIIDHGIRMTAQSQTGASQLSDPRNEHVLVWVGDRIVPREMAKVSVFDSSVQGGDAVWEGLRVYNGVVFKMDEHIERLFDSSKALAFENIPTKFFIVNAIMKTLAANGMHDGVHMRLTLTRGAKITSSMNPKFNIFGTNLIILPEWKPVGDMATYDNNRGIKLITATNRRNPPQCVDSKIHHCNLINNILPKIQANVSGAADALMLDTEGFVSETNATNVFCIKHGIVYTPHADFCLPGITRQTIMKLIPNIGLQLVERRISLAEFHTADEVFTTGTMGELTPVYEIDGRLIGDGCTYPIINKIQKHFRELTETLI